MNCSLCEEVFDGFMPKAFCDRCENIIIRTRNQQAERRELFKQVALAVISNNYHHSDWLKGAEWINPVVENILSAAETFSKETK